MAALAYDAEVEWFIRCGAYALGERGTSGQMLDLLRYGIPSGGGVPVDTHTDRQLDGVRKARFCCEVYGSVSHRAQGILAARYGSRPWLPGIRATLGELAGVVAELSGIRVNAVEVELSRVCQSLKREDATKRTRWLRDAEKASEQAHGEWSDVRGLLLRTKAQAWVNA